MRTRFLTGVAVAAIAGALSVPAAAQSTPQSTAESGGNGIADIIVTAQRRSESSQKVPITINAIDSASLTRTGVSNVNDLAKLVPGFRGSGDNGAASPHLRGVGSVSASAGNDSALSYYVDGVYIPTTIQVPTQIRDAERVEVLKGPQGTLFGRNATAGLVQVITRSPTDVPAIEGEFGYGNYATKKAYAYVGGPVVSNVAAGITFNGSWQGDGWGHNLASGEDVRKITSNISVRGKIVFKPSTTTKVTLSADYARAKGYGIWSFSPDVDPENTAFGPVSLKGNPWNINSDRTAPSDAKAGGVSGTVVQDIGFATLTNIAAYRKDSLHAPNIDFDMTPFNGVGYSAPAHEHMFSEELQLSSSSRGPFRWTAGVYYFHEFNSVDANELIGAPLQPGFGGIANLNDVAYQKTRSISGYVQADYEFAKGTTFTAGGRYTDERRLLRGNQNFYLSNGTVLPQPVSTKVADAKVPTWRFALNHEFTSQILGYASVSKGFKSGGFNVADSTNPAFGPEKLIAYEAGLKSTLLDHKLRVNLSGFYYDYRGIQLSAFNPNGGTSLQQIYNAAAARMYGLDVDLEVRPLRGLTVAGGFELMHGEYTNFPDAIISSPNPAGGYNIALGSAKGNDTAQTPTFSGSALVSYEFTTRIGKFVASADASYNSGYFFEADNRARQKSYTLVGSTVRWTLPGNKFYFEVWGKNLANELIRDFYITTQFSSGSQVEPPRTYGMTAGFKF